jgi:hypothetical protein
MALAEGRGEITSESATVLFLAVEKNNLNRNINMNNELLNLLSVQRLPGRLNSEQVAQLIGFSPDDIPILIKAKLMKALGNPAQNAVKYFATVEIEKFTRDEAWLSRATKAIYNHWSSRNRRRKTKIGEAMQSSLSGVSSVSEDRNT